MEIVFVSPWSKRSVNIGHKEEASPAVPGLVRIASITALGVTLSNRFSACQWACRHADNLLASCVRANTVCNAYYAILWASRPMHCMQAIFQLTVVAKQSCALPANADYKTRRSYNALRSSDFVQLQIQPWVSQIRAEADDKLFRNVSHNKRIYSALSCLLLVTIITASEARIIISGSYSDHHTSIIETFSFVYFFNT